MNDLWLWNRQRVRPVHLPLLRRITRALIDEQLRELPFEIGIYLVAAPEMAELNETFLQHHGSTDVITFPYTDPHRDHLVQGEIFVSVEDAVRQARQFRSSWQAELVRYVAHGILHLHGYTDEKATERRRMKRQEDRLVKWIAREFPLRSLHRHSKPR